LAYLLLSFLFCYQICICENKNFWFLQIASASGACFLPEVPPGAGEAMSATAAKHNLTTSCTVLIMSGENYIPDRQILLAITGREKPMKYIIFLSQQIPLNIRIFSVTTVKPDQLICHILCP